MVYLHFPTKLTDEEMLLRQKYSKLRRKKKALEVYQAPKVEPTVSNPLKRPLEPKDAKEYAKKMILMGKITVNNKDSSTNKKVFRRPGGLQRKLSESQSRVVVDVNSPIGVLATAATVLKQPEIATKDHGSSSVMAIKGHSDVDKFEEATQVVDVPSFVDTSQSGLHYQPFTPTTAGLPESTTTSSSTEFSPKYRPISGPRHRVVSLGTGDDRRMKKEGRPRPGHTVHVRGGRNQLTEEMCREAFGKIGNVVNLSMELERSCAFVTFDKIESAEKAIVELNGSSIGEEVQIQVSFARRQPAVAELINDAPASATWTALASSQSQKGAHHDKRDFVVYDTSLNFSLPDPEPMEISPSQSTNRFPK